MRGLAQRLHIILEFPGSSLGARRAAGGEARGQPAEPDLSDQIPVIARGNAVAELHIQIIAPPRQPWRLTVLALGPVLSAEGARLRPGQIRWRGSPGAVFLDGVLSPGSPQLCGRGEGPKAGVLHFTCSPPRKPLLGTTARNCFFP